MSDELIRKMCKEFTFHQDGLKSTDFCMRAAVRVLADGVTDEMVNRSWKYSGLADVTIQLLDAMMPDHRDRQKKCIATAIRAAAK